MLANSTFQPFARSPLGQNALGQAPAGWPAAGQQSSGPVGPLQTRGPAMMPGASQASNAQQLNARASNGMGAMTNAPQPQTLNPWNSGAQAATAPGAAQDRKSVV